MGGRQTLTERMECGPSDHLPTLWSGANCVPISSSVHGNKSTCPHGLVERAQEEVT